MTRMEDNASPYLTILESTEPSAPSAGNQRLYIDSTSHRLSRTNSSGTERDLELGTFHGVKAGSSGTTNVTTSTWTPIAMAAADAYDTDAYHDPASNNTRLVVPTGLAGYYEITGQAVWDTNTTGTRFLGIMKNGTEQNLYISQPPLATGLNQQRSPVILLLAVADYLELGVYQDSGTTRTVGGSVLTFVSMRLVGV